MEITCPGTGLAGYKTDWTESFWTAFGDGLLVFFPNVPDHPRGCCQVERLWSLGRVTHAVFQENNTNIPLNSCFTRWNYVHFSEQLVQVHVPTVSIYHQSESYSNSSFSKGPFLPFWLLATVLSQNSFKALCQEVSCKSIFCNNPLREQD